MKGDESRINEAATEALANEMYRYTFGIIGDNKYGAEGRGLGTGIGVYWRGIYALLTAAHTIENTPYERLYFLLPGDSVVMQGSSIPVQQAPFTVRKRLQLERPQALFAENVSDLAAFVLPEQVQEQGQRHFYPLDHSHITPHEAKQIGFLGFPGVTALPVNQNFMATPYFSFGEMRAATTRPSSDTAISITYPAQQSIDPHGMSGCGLWIPTMNPSEGLWTPDITLIGLVTSWNAQSEVLVGYPIEELVKLLQANIP